MLFNMMNRIAWLTVLISVAGSARSNFCSAAAPPAGTEFPINTFTSGDQRAWPEAPGSVAMDSAGNFVVVWASAQDGSDSGVYGQRFNATGQKQGSEFRVNTTTIGHQRYPTVAMDSAGNFVVTWTSADVSGTGIFAQRYNAAGQTLGVEFPVNTTTGNDQKFSVVSMNAGGAFVVTWTSLNTGTPYPDVYARRFNASGVGQGNDFVVANSYTDPTQGEHGFMFPSTAMDDSGNFVVAFAEYTSQTYTTLQVLRYSNTGSLLGSTVVRSAGPPGISVDIRHTHVDIDAAGNFVLVWIEAETVVRARRYSLAGAPLTGFIEVYSGGGGFDLYPRVALDESNNFVVCWDHQDAQDYYDIYARSYSASGAPQSNPFLVNTATTNNQQYSSIAMAPNGNHVIVWTAYNNQDGSNGGMFGQRYATESSECPAERLMRAAKAAIPRGPWTPLLKNMALSPTELNDLRRFRDEILSRSATGQELVRAYYTHGPEMAAAAIQQPLLLVEALQLMHAARHAVRNVTPDQAYVPVPRSTFDRGLKWIDAVARSLPVESQRSVQATMQRVHDASTTRGEVTILSFDDPLQEFAPE